MPLRSAATPVSQALAERVERHRIELQVIQLGKPTQNAHIERFHRTRHAEAMECYLFETLADARRITKDWMQHYDHERAHKATGFVRPAQRFAANC